jgi:hypothetical protein
MKLSTAAKVMLDAIKEMQGEVEFDADAASLIWGGSEGAKIADLTPGQLLQFALIDSHRQLNELYDMIEEMVVSEQVMAQLNREQRRKLEKSKLQIASNKLIVPGNTPQ